MEGMAGGVTVDHDRTPRFPDSFFRGKNVFVTGHTGFKGSWLCMWLSALGANVTGYALDPPTIPSLFDLCGVGSLINSVIADVRDARKLTDAMRATNPDLVFHMAAQPLVRDSYRNLVDTYSTNVMGTVHLLEAVRACESVKSVVIVTSDKCYENREWLWGYREDDPLGGYDPYSSSKACSELVTAAYRRSFFDPKGSSMHGATVASARAGNVIGGGDWAADRLVPDCIRSLLKGEKILIRNPDAVRPWQHVIEPLFGYLMLAERLYKDGPRFTGAWNFGPRDEDARSVEWVVKRICAEWGEGAGYTIDSGGHPHEAHYLKLDCSKTRAALGWLPRWNLEKAIQSVAEWTLLYRDGGDLRAACMRQIEEYTRTLH